MDGLRRMRAGVVAPSRPTSFLEQELRKVGLVPDAAILAPVDAVSDPMEPVVRAARSLGLWDGRRPVEPVRAFWSAVVQQTMGKELQQVECGPEGLRFVTGAGVVSLPAREAARAVELLRIVLVRAAVLRRNEGALGVMVTAGMFAGAEASERRAWRRALSELSGTLQVICLETAG